MRPLFFCKISKVLRSNISHKSVSYTHLVWDDDTVPAMKRERNLPAVLSRDEINAIIDATPNLKMCIRDSYSRYYDKSFCCQILHEFGLYDDDARCV